MSDLPPSWLALYLGDVINYGKTDKVEPEDIPADAWILELEDIEKDSSKLINKVIFSERRSKSTKNRFNKDDVLYGKLRPYLNKVIIASEPGFASTEIIPLSSKGLINNRYLFYWLKHPTFLAYVDAVSHGINMPRLGTEAGRRAPFVLAPLNEQKRIADKLDILFSRLDACRERIHRVRRLFPEQFQSSVICQAFRGDLSRGLLNQRDAAARDEIAKVRERILPNAKQDYYPSLTLSDLQELEQLPPGWRWEKAGNICQSIVPNRDKPKSFSGNISWVTTPQLSESAITINFDLSKDGLSEEEVETYNARVVPSQSVIMTCVGSLGIAAVTRQPCVINQQLHAFVCHDHINPSYLAYALKLQKSWLEQNSTSTTVRYLNKKNCNSVPIPLCSKEEQEIIVSKIELLFANCNRIESAMETLERRLDELSLVILKVAFRGELVAQEPNDETALELLARIQNTTLNNTLRKPKKDKKEKILV